MNRSRVMGLVDDLDDDLGFEPDSLADDNPMGMILGEE
jgi:hypothetical protein